MSDGMLDPSRSESEATPTNNPDTHGKHEGTKQDELPLLGASCLPPTAWVKPLL